MAKEKSRRREASKQWKKYFNERYKREPTKEEGETFGNGFGAGWKAHMKISSKYLYEVLSEVINNLEDDLQMDKSGESGYKNEKEVVKAINKFTLKLVRKKLKMAEHNYLASARQDLTKGSLLVKTPSSDGKRGSNPPLVIIVNEFKMEKSHSKTKSRK